MKCLFYLLVLCTWYTFNMNQHQQKTLIISVLLLLIAAVVVSMAVSFIPNHSMPNTTDSRQTYRKTVPPTHTTIDVRTVPPTTMVASTSVIDSTETMPQGGAPYVNVNNVDEITGLPVISSPKLGDRYLLRDTIKVTWNPELIDASGIVLYHADDFTRGMQIYGRQRLDDSVTTNAEFDYVIPDNLTVYPGQYILKIFDVGSHNVYTSDVFTIDSPAPLLQRQSAVFRIGSVYGIKDSYSVGDSMSLNVEAFDGDGTGADNSKGFNIQARLYDINNNSMWSDNAAYSADAHIWHISVPVKPNSYRVGIILYCSLETFSSICGQEYGYDKQVEHFVNFTLK